VAFGAWAEAVALHLLTDRTILIGVGCPVRPLLGYKETKMDYSKTLLLALLCMTTATAAGEPLLRHVDVFVSGQEGYVLYRIPAVTTTARGTILAFAEARKYNAKDPGEKGQEIDLVLKRSADGGDTWSAMRVIEHSGKYWSSANPATVVDRSNGRVWVFYIRCKPGRGTDAARPGTDDAANFVRWSDDDGLTWSEPIDQTFVARDRSDGRWGISVPGPGGAVQDRKGRLIVPMWRYAPWGNFVLLSEDHGRTWHRCSLVQPPQGGDEDQLVELSDGRLLLDIRQQSGPHRWTATSADGGRTWSPPQAGQPATPVCCAIKRYTLQSAGDDRDRLLWTGPKGPGRNGLVVRTSYDEGRTFTSERLISAGPAAYSDLTVLKDKSIGVFWERGDYKFLTFTHFAREFLEPPSFVYVCRDAGAGGYQAFPDVCRLSDGRLMCVFYAGYGHVSVPNQRLPKGGRICSCTSSDEGRTWTKAETLYDGPDDDRDPSIAQLRSGQLVCNFFSLRQSDGPGKPLVGLGSWIVTSGDLGKTWSAPRQLCADYYCSSPVRELSNGQLIVGLYRELPKTSIGAVGLSDDGGRTWRAVDIDNGGFKLDAETDVVELADGALYAAQRPQMCFSISRDRGNTWSVSKPIGFPGHCPYFLRTRDNIILLAHRLPSTSLHYSLDECKTWSGNVLVDSVGGAYPSMVNLKDGTVLIVYYEEGAGSSIRCKRFRATRSGIEWLGM
jgi:hypothetical protein